MIFQKKMDTESFSFKFKFPGKFFFLSRKNQKKFLMHFLDGEFEAVVAQEEEEEEESSFLQSYIIIKGFRGFKSCNF